jgi:opacity protein-like surface antigen
MKRHLALSIALACITAAPAFAGNIGVSAFGGMSYSVLQSDVGNGALYGVRVPIRLVPLVAVEPWYATTSLGDKVQTVANVSLTQPGFDESAWGANVLLATGGPLSFYPYAGIGRATFKLPGGDTSHTTYSAGFGLGVSPMPKLSLDLRGEFQAVMDKDPITGKDSVRKFGNATVGLGYALFSMP